ncbi:MAG: hypothetical protein ACE5EE_03850 [Fidelibacterota bacterium]
MKFGKFSSFLKINKMIFILSLFLTQLIFAYPGFGKKINPVLTQSCNQCHVAFPKLRLYGRTIREIGYQVPVAEVEDESLIKSIYRSVPIGVRGKIYLAHTDNGKPRLDLLQLLSSGTVFNNKVSWWYHKHLYDVEGDKDNKVIDSDKFVPLNEGQPHELWFQYNYSTAINFRAGMFELPFWLSPIKTKIGESEYLCHEATGNPDMTGTLASPQFGLAINGYLGKRTTEDDWGEEEEENFIEGYNYAFAVTNGKAEFPKGFDFLSDSEGSSMDLNTFFGRVTKKNSWYAVGIWALTGKSKIVHEDDHDTGDMDMHGETTANQRYYRLGTDFDLYIRGDDVNLYGDFVYGNDVNRDFIGWLLGYDNLVLPKLLGLIRWTGVSFLNGDNPSEIHNEHEGEDDHTEGGGHVHGAMIMDNASSLSAGIFYLIYNNIRLGFEYEYQLYGDIGKDIHGKGGQGIIQIQFGF